MPVCIINSQLTENKLSLHCFLGFTSKDGLFAGEIRKRLTLGRKAMTTLDKIRKDDDISVQCFILKAEKCFKVMQE